MNVLQVTAHQLLLCVATLEALAHNPNVYPPGVIAHRAQRARSALALSSEGKRLLEDGKGTDFAEHVVREAAGKGPTP